MGGARLHRQIGTSRREAFRDDVFEITVILLVLAGIGEEVRALFRLFRLFRLHSWPWLRPRPGHPGAV